MDGVTLEELKVIIDAQTKPFRDEIDKAKTQMRSATADMKAQADKIKSVFGSIKSYLAKLGITTVLYKIGTAAITMARQFESSTQQINKLMGESAQAFMRWGKQNALAFNMSQSEFAQYGSTYANLLSSFINSTSGVANYTTELLKASSIIASGTGRTMTDVMERIRSGLLGNTEAIEDLGVNVNVAMLESTDAFKKFAGDRSWNQLDFQTQQQIRLFGILEQTTKKYGDSVLQNTNSYMAQFSAIAKDCALNIGNILLPVLNAILPPLIQIGTIIRNATSYMATFMQMLFGYSPSTAKSSNAVSSLNDALTETTTNANKASKALGGLMGFDELNVISSGSSSGNSSSSGGSNIDYGSIGGVFSEEPDTSGIQKAVTKVKEQISELKQFISDNAVIIVALFAGIAAGIIALQIPGIITSFIAPIVSLIGWVKNFGLAIQNFGVFKTVLTGIGAVLGGLSWPIVAVATAIAGVTTALVYLYNTSDEFRTLVNKAVQSIGSVLKNLWTNVLQPIYKFLVDMFNAVIVPIASFLGTAFVSAVDCVASIFMHLWNEILAPLANFLVNNFGAKFTDFANKATKAVSGVKTVFSGLSSYIKSTFDIVKGVFNGIITFISGIFKGNWKKAWQGVKDIFSSIITGFANIFKKPINAIIDGINSFITGLNKIKIPSWVPAVGGKGFNIAKIPRLAHGGIIDSSTIANIGEAGSEAVIPLERNTGGIEKIAKRLGAFMQFSGSDEVLDMLSTIIDILNDIDFNPTFEMDSDVITKKTNKNNERKDLRTGYAY